MLLFLSILLSISARAYSERIEMQSINRVNIEGWAVDLRVVANEKIQFARLRSKVSTTGERKPIQSIVENGSLTINVVGEAREDLFDKSVKPIELYIEMPSRPLVASFRQGRIQAKGWKQPLVGSVIEGDIFLAELEAPQKLHVKKGKIQISKSQGNAEVANYEGSTVIDQMAGELRLLQFSGQARLSGIKGAQRIQSYDSSTQVRDSEGRINFELVGGNFRTFGHKGAIEGSGDEANIRLGVDYDPYVRVKSKTGQVVVSLPKNSGAYLNFGSESGDIVVPDYLAVDRFPNLKVARGRLRGTEGRGSIRVRTESALSVFRVDR